MEIGVEKFSRYKEVTVRGNNFTFESGLLNKREVLDIAIKFLEVVVELVDSDIVSESDTETLDLIRCKLEELGTKIYEV